MPRGSRGDAALRAVDYIMFHTNGQTPEEVHQTIAAMRRWTGYERPLIINEDGEPVLKRPTARKPPASSMELEAAIQTFLPERSLLDVLWLVNSATRFTRHFGPLWGLDAKLENLEERYCATAFVMGSGLGVGKAFRACC